MTSGTTLNSKSKRVTAAAEHIRRTSNTNMVEFTARLHETQAIKLLIGFAQDKTQSPKFRRACAMDILKLARGGLREWWHNGETIDPNALGRSGLGGTVAQELEAARLTADLYTELNRLIEARIDSASWPESIREVCADMIHFYQNEETTSM